MKKRVLLIIFAFIGCGTLLWSDPNDSNASLVPFTLEIAQNTQNLQKLRFFLSKSLSITPPEKNDASLKYDVNEEGNLISRKKSPEEKIGFKTTDVGTLSTIGRSFESIIVAFNGTELMFIKNSKGRYDLTFAKYDSMFYTLRPVRNYDEEPYQLYIINTDAELSGRGEMRTVSDSEQNSGQRRTIVQRADDTEPVYRDLRAQPYQTINTGTSFNQPSGQPSRNIDGDSYVNKKGISAYVTRMNPSVNRDTLNRLIDTYITEAAIERINLDIAIAQMLYATNYLKNQQRMANHNYAALSSTPVWNGSFYNMISGVRAHIQHLKGYASGRLNSPLVDPRYQVLADMGYLGTVRTFDQLFKAWTAGPTDYEREINEILKGLYWFSGN